MEYSHHPSKDPNCEPQCCQCPMHRATTTYTFAPFLPPHKEENSETKSLSFRQRGTHKEENSDTKSLSFHQPETVLNELGSWDRRLEGGLWTKVTCIIYLTYLYKILLILNQLPFLYSTIRGSRWYSTLWWHRCKEF